MLLYQKCRPTYQVSLCRNKFEPEEQWELRRKFMETYKHLPEDRVVCLAQVLVNIEFLGTKYLVSYCWAAYLYFDI